MAKYKEPKVAGYVSSQAGSHGEMEGDGGTPAFVTDLTSAGYGPDDSIPDDERMRELDRWCCNHGR